MMRKISRQIVCEGVSRRSLHMLSRSILIQSPLSASSGPFSPIVFQFPQWKCFSTENLSEKQFHIVCDETLELIQDELADLESDFDDAEISLSQGVLNINLGTALGTWVINKQTPNRQIWWSSPISGPRRYEYQPDPSGKLSPLREWKYSRDGTSLLEALQKEMLKATGDDKLFENF